MTEKPEKVSKPLSVQPTVEREVRYRVAEHEVFLSFLQDADAAMFQDWWNVKGSAQWLRWADANRKDYE
jgi:hypothetical protein